MFMLLFVLFVAALSAPHVPCKVAFRIDDVQDSLLVSTQKAVIQSFVDHSVPFSLGIVSQSFGVDSTSSMVPFIEGFLQQGKDIEISIMSRDPTAWTNTNLSYSETVCHRAITKLTHTLPANKRAIKTLHCPTNVFNQAAMDALRNCSISVLSSVYRNNISKVDGHSFYSSCADTMTPIHGIIHIPSNAITSTNANGILLSNAALLSSMESACNTCGHAVLEVHFPEFSNKNLTTQANATAVINLGSLISTIKGWANVSIKVLQDMYTAPVTPQSPSAPKAPSAPKTPSSPSAPKTPSAPKAPVTPSPKSSRISGSTSMHPIMFVVFFCLVLQVWFG